MRRVVADPAPREVRDGVPHGKGHVPGSEEPERHWWNLWIRRGEPLFPSAYMYFFLWLVLAAIFYNSFLLVGFMRPSSSFLRAGLVRIGTDAEIWQQTQEDLRRFRIGGRHWQDQRTPRNFGLTAGAYAAEMPPSCKKKLLSQCNWNVSAQGRPPVELLAPGPLGARANLSELSLCFLWYSGSFWTRATGGARGKLLARHGGGVDNKANLASWMRLYEVKFGCRAHQVLPLTVDLREHRTCEAFFRHNGKLAASNSSLWFLKDVKGSTGRHIRLLRQSDIQHSSLHAQGSDALAKRATICNNSVASLGVRNIATMHQRKFDHRVFVLLASLRPLVVYIHHGHLRFSALNLTESAQSQDLDASGGRWKSRGQGYQTSRSDASMLEDLDLARHVTNPRFGMRHSGDSNVVLRPSADLFAHVAVLTRAAVRREGMGSRAGLEMDGQELGDAQGWGRGSGLDAALQDSIVNALLQVVFAIAHRFYLKGDKTTWGHAWLAADVVYDDKFAPKVVDLNSGPSFYHSEKGKDWPAWFVRERSELTRGAQDLLQDVAFRKLSVSVGSRSVNATSRQGRGRDQTGEGEGGNSWEKMARQALDGLPGTVSGWVLAYSDAAHSGIAADGLLANLRQRASINSSAPAVSHAPTNRTSSAYPPAAWLKPGMCFRRRVQKAKVREARAAPGGAAA